MGIRHPASRPDCRRTCPPRREEPFRLLPRRSAREPACPRAGRGDGASRIAGTGRTDLASHASHAYRPGGGGYGSQVGEEHAPYGAEAGRRLRLTPELLADALRRAGNNKARAARLLGVSRQTVYRKLVEFGMSEGATGEATAEADGGTSEGGPAGP